MIELYILFIIVGVVVHEAFHAIALLTVGINHENIKFGVVWKRLSPYTYCSESMPVWKYWYSLVLPNFIFFIITLLVASTSTHNYLHQNIIFVVSLAILLGGCSDFYVLYKTRRISINTYVQDSSTKIGCDICA